MKTEPLPKSNTKNIPNEKKINWDKVKLTPADAEHARKVAEETVKALNSLK